jgi:uncharacterized membrane protein YfcA
VEVYLPIAGISENVFVLLGLGAAIGVLSGLFGVGGGFLLTPLLILLGIPPPVAVSSSANQVVGASISGVLAHWRRGNVDVKLGGLLIVGGVVGSSAGVALFKLLRSLGQVELTISLAYVLLLGSIGALMFVESLRAILKRRRRTGPGGASGRGPHRHTWAHRLPWKMRFPRSKLYMSAYLPLGLGFLVGILSAIMGVGGGFVLIPAMIYLLGMPTSVVVGTSLLQVIFVTANVTFLQAVQTQTVDVVLAVILLAGGVIGAQIGTRIGAGLRGEQLRIILATLVLAVSLKVLYDLTIPPIDVYSVGISAA